jgi:hypothetical protein
MIAALFGYGGLGLSVHIFIIRLILYFYVLVEKRSEGGGKLTLRLFYRDFFCKGWKRQKFYKMKCKKLEISKF